MTNDLAWAAGFLEGEGCFAVSGPGMKVQASQVQKWPLEKLQQMFGGAIYLRHRAQEKHSDCWSWQASGVQAIGIAMTVYAFLSPRRQLQIRHALREWRSHPTADRFKIHCVAGHPLFGSNVRLEDGGRRRRCRKCADAARRRWKERAA